MIYDVLTTRPLSTAALWVLHIHVQESVRPQLPPASPAGVVTRARLYGPDDEVPRYRIAAIEKPVTELPRTRVMRISEVVGDHRVATPLTDEFDAQARLLAPLQADTTGTPLCHACSGLGAD
ncbi:hypothetical protein SRB17_75550 [Streptomyces sp. RB17]|uniref:hypothetical protein n=1 Tax=Streptomyces sp. RB17 TaxID=2585197 RepID=UPI00129601B9|nr:hypothetical protein [Streptomyces sp. RB17]MQY39528.1 hypothetical protein [Streptomyces sp. RB17]